MKTFETLIDETAGEVLERFEALRQFGDQSRSTYGAEYMFIARSRLDEHFEANPLDLASVDRMMTALSPSEKAWFAAALHDAIFPLVEEAIFRALDERVASHLPAYGEANDDDAHTDRCENSISGIKYS